MACVTYCVVGFMAQCTVAELYTTMRGALQCYVLEEGSFNIALASLDLEVTVGEQCAAWESLRLSAGSPISVAQFECVLVTLGYKSEALAKTEGAVHEDPKHISPSEGSQKEAVGVEGGAAPSAPPETPDSVSVAVGGGFVPAVSVEEFPENERMHAAEIFSSVRGAQAKEIEARVQVRYDMFFF